MILCSCLLLVRWQAPTVACLSLHATRCDPRMNSFKRKTHPHFRFRQTDNKNLNVLSAKQYYEVMSAIYCIVCTNFPFKTCTCKKNLGTLIEITQVEQVTQDMQKIIVSQTTQKNGNFVQDETDDTTMLLIQPQRDIKYSKPMTIII